MRSLVQLDSHARVSVASEPGTSKEKEAGRGLGDSCGLEPWRSKPETLQARLQGFSASAGPPQQVREEEAARESCHRRTEAGASVPRAGLKPPGTACFCCCAPRRRRRHRGGPGGGAAREGGGGGGGEKRRSRGWRMEPRAAAEGSPEPAASSSFQARLWKNLQLGLVKSKGSGSSGRAGGQERRPAATPSPSPPPPGGRREALAGTGSRWIGFKKRKQVLDRVFSSSQPNLCCSSTEALEPGGPGKAEQGSTLRRRIREHLLPAGKGPAAAAGVGGGTPPGGRSPDSAPSSSSASSSLSSSPQPPSRGDHARDEGAWRRGTAALLRHQKSSSLPGTANLEQLLEPPPAEPARSPSKRMPEKGGERGSSQVRCRCQGPRLQLRAN